MKLTPILLGLALFTGSTHASSAPFSFEPTQAVVAGGVEGTWLFEMPQPGVVELAAVELTIEVAPDGEVSALAAISQGAMPLEGSWDEEHSKLVLGGSFLGIESRLEAVLEGESLVGRIALAGATIPITAKRPDETTERTKPIVVDFSVPRPSSVSREALSPELAEEITGALLEVIENQRVVGLSAAFVVDGEVIDVRHFGWQDFPARVPTSEATMYRWASISKPLTAVVALQLGRSGALDLDADVREYVPEFPEKRWPFTSRQLLCHQAGIVHYAGMGLRPMIDYEVEHPWSDRILSMDLFKNAALLAEPGSAFSYTTPGYVILGAVIERAGEKRYDELVTERIAKPLGMTSMQPDYPMVEIPQRTRGYVKRGERVVDSGTDDISWKLPAGGWISTVEDLARFGAGLMGTELLTLEDQIEMWTRQKTQDGQDTDYGLGVGVRRLDGLVVVAHSGGQLKTSTFLMCCPERNVAVALMCNTQGTGLAQVARTALLALLRE